MLIRRFTFTVLTLIIFVASLYHDGLIFSVSGETVALAQKHISVKQGVTQDGALALTLVADVAHVPPRKKAPNHERTLRAFIAPDRGGIATLYVESVIPHMFYSVTGRYNVSQDYPVLMWPDEGTIVFYGTSSDDVLYELALDVRTLMLDVRIADEAEIPVDWDAPSDEMAI